MSQIPRRERPKNRERPTQRTTTIRAPSSSEDDATNECPEPYGFFADADQCDKYYQCNDK